MNHNVLFSFLIFATALLVVVATVAIDYKKALNAKKKAK